MDPIAIIGIGCRFATASNAEEFFDLLRAGVDATVDVPADRWNLESFYDADRRTPGKLAAGRGGFLPRIDGFDAAFFGISPREAACMDPQQRLLLEVAWEAMENAGEPPTSLAGTDVGVYMGAFTLDYKRIQLGYLNRRLMDTHTATGAMMTMVSNRLSHAFDFRGPSMSIDTACSSSLVAVHMACNALRNSECAVALAGGVNIMVTPEYTIAESKGGFLAPDGRSKPFSADANGYARAEGAGVVMLKPLSKALEDRDPIYAVIRGSAVNQDGRTDGITVPSGEAQTRLIHEACRRAGVSAAQLQYVEAHGTGTPVGDPIEAKALAAALGAERDEAAPRCVVGSVKGNIGHAEAAAGVAGLIKATMAMRNRQIPPNLHFDNPNTAIPFNDLAIRVPKTVEPWPTSTGPALAGVNSFGFGGTNAHLILEEAPALERRTADDAPAGAAVFPLSARSPEALEAVAAQMREAARGADATGISFSDLLYSAAQRRSHHSHRLGVVAGSSRELAELLDAHLDGQERSEIGAGSTSSAERTRVAFVCTGMGPQWWGMGRELFAAEPVFRKQIVRCDEIFQEIAGWSLLEEMLADEASSNMAETRLAQPANFAIQVALAALWKSWGIAPDAIVGHSVGEVSAAYLSGALTLEDALLVSFQRSRLQQTTAGQGAMLAAGITAEEVVEWTKPYDGRISPAAVNAPSSVTLSGDPDVIQDLSERLSDKDIFNRVLRVDIAYHSAQMNPLKAELLESLAAIKPRTAKTPLYSTVFGDAADGSEIDASYWWRNVREPVRFHAAMSSLVREGFDCFLEIGPHPVLASSIRDCLASEGKQGRGFCSLRRKDQERPTMLSALASLYANGCDVRWEAFHGSNPRFVPLPTYPWQRERYWSESEESLADRVGKAIHPLLGHRSRAARPTWDVEINKANLPYLQDHAVGGAVVFPGAGYVEMALAAARETYGPGAFTVEDIRFDRALFLPDAEPPSTQVALDESDASFEISTRTNDQRWVRNAYGRLAQSPARALEPIDVHTIRDRCAPALDRPQCYDAFSRQGFHYGPAFQRIERLWVGDGEALANFGDVPTAEGPYQLHPTLLDACFQALVATNPFSGDEQQSYMPVGVKRIRVVCSPQGILTAWARLTHRDSSSAAGSISLIDAAGDVVVEIEGLEVKALDAADVAVSREKLDRDLYDVQWSSAEPLGAEATPSELGCWLLLADATGVAAPLADRLRQAGNVVIEAHPGEAYSFKADALVAVVKPEEKAHFDRLLDDVRQTVSRPLTGVVHGWNLNLGTRLNAAEELAYAESLGVQSAFHLMQSVLERDRAPKVWALTRGAQEVGTQAAVAAPQAAVWGLGRVAGQQECVGTWAGLIDLDPHAGSEETDMILRELTASTGEDQVAFRGAERFVPRFERCGDLAPTLPSRLRSDGSYLVTGAFGALGRLTVRWMVEHGARRLVLLSRSGLPARSQWSSADLPSGVRDGIELVQELESLGTSVTVAAVDVADAEQLDRFLEEYEAGGQAPIRGVIHSAGLVKDQLLPQMSAQAFRDVLRPKVHGAWNLSRAFRDVPLDFFVLYSSIGSVMAAAGQANYASANAFLDALARDRRRQGLPALSINWGPWAVGMVKELNLVQHYADRGFEVITPNRGMAQLDRLLTQPRAQASVLTANWRKLAEAQVSVPPMFAHLVAQEQGDAASSGEQTEDFLTVLLTSDPAEHIGLMEEQLGGLAARVLRMDPEKFVITEPLSALGLDSMMAMELKARIEASVRAPVSVLELIKGVSVTELAPSLLAHVIEENEDIHQVLAEIEQLSEGEPVASGGLGSE